MNRSLILITISALLLSSCKKDERLCIFCSYTDKAPMDESFDWNQIPPTRMTCDSLSDNTVDFRCVWDCDSLYLHFDVRDSRLWALQTEKDHKALWKDDIVEFLIDAENHHSPGWKTDDIIYHFNVLGQKKDDRGKGDGSSDPTWDGEARWILDVCGTVCDNSDTDSGYSVRVAIPWTEIGREARKGTDIGFIFGCNDNDGIEVPYKALFNWTGANPTRSPEQFGQLILTK